MAVDAADACEIKREIVPTDDDPIGGRACSGAPNVDLRL